MDTSRYISKTSLGTLPNAILTDHSYKENGAKEKNKTHYEGGLPSILDTQGLEEAWASRTPSLGVASHGSRWQGSSRDLCAGLTYKLGKKTAQLGDTAEGPRVMPGRHPPPLPPCRWQVRCWSRCAGRPAKDPGMQLLIGASLWEGHSQGWCQARGALSQVPQPPLRFAGASSHVSSFPTPSRSQPSQGQTLGRMGAPVPPLAFASLTSITQRTHGCPAAQEGASRSCLHGKATGEPSARRSDSRRVSVGTAWDANRQRRGKTSSEAAQSALAALTDTTDQRLVNSTLSFHASGSGGWRSKIKASADPVSGENPPPGS